MYSERTSHSGYARILDVAARRWLPFRARVDLTTVDGDSHGTLVIAPDGRTLTIVDGSGTVQTWDVNTHTRVHQVRANLSGVGFATWASLDPTGRFMASLVVKPPDCVESAFDIIDVRDGRRVAELECIDDVYWHEPVFSPDGHLLVVGTMSGELLLWDTQTWKLLHRWGANDGLTISYGFTPDSRYVFSGGTDGKVGLWDVRDPARSGFTIDATRSGANPVYVGTSRDGRELVTLPQVGAPLRWDISADSLARRACDIVRRSVTDEEWTAVLPDRPYQQTCPG